MNLIKLVEKQKYLDDIIKEECGLEQEYLQNKKILALLVEIGECCNEIQEFKFWKKNITKDDSKIKEELVDILHFILSIGIESNMDFHQVSKYAFNKADPSDELNYSFLRLNPTDELNYSFIRLDPSDELNHSFIWLYTATTDFYWNRTMDNYIRILQYYNDIVDKLGLTPTDIEEEYNRKNNINLERQENGY